MTGKRANGTTLNVLSFNKFDVKPVSNFSNDTTCEVKPPTVSQKSIEIYKNYVNLGIYGPQKPKQADMEVYRKYASLK